ncbi:MAG: hypothetical protein HY078_14790 [Elusimicrobia bacterium]|nr:hypothetical protein [Elusimicrobiota bacterium]
MSGVAGILMLDGSPVDLDVLRGMREALSHRGPHGGGVWTSGSIGLAHAFLEIDPEAPQPLVRGGRCLAMDGRIDNVDALAARMSGEPLLGAECGWTAPEAVLGAFERWGERCLPALLGDFAFAMWDARAQRLLLARDPMGLKPLFYWTDGVRLAFASEAKAIFAAPWVPCVPDPVRHAELKDYRFRSIERTFFEGVQRLVPGECLEASRAGMSRRVFWAPDPQRRVRMPNRKAYRDRFRALFVEAVRCRLPKRGVAAVRLSGGLDSSAIAGAAAAAARDGRPLERVAVSILTDLIPDERRHVRAVCGDFGMESLSFRPESASFLDGLEAALYHQEAPFYEPIDTWILALHRLAADRGARVVLGGEWGDQITTSGAYLTDLFLQGRWATFAREFWLFPRHDGGRYRDLAKLAFWYLVLPERISDRYEGLRHLLRKTFMPWRKTEPGGPKFKTAYQRERYDAVFGTLNTMCLEMLERMAAQCGVEARLPFRDRRLVNFALAIPWEEVVRDGRGRRLEREALEGILPASIAARGDKGDYTDLESTLLKAAGFENGHDGMVWAWRRRIAAIWEETWTKRRENHVRGDTRRPVLSNTAA